MDKILVACPVHECKEYCFQQWIDNVKKFTYPNYEIFVVDNSPTLDFFNRYNKQIPMEHIEVDQKFPLNRITKSMEIIRQKFLNGDYFRWFNLESDVIPPVNIIEFLLDWGRDSDWISHCYPMRENKDDFLQGIGCSMMTKKLVETFNFNETGASCPDVWLWDYVRKANQFRTMELWSYIDIKHLKE